MAITGSSPANVNFGMRNPEFLLRPASAARRSALAPINLSALEMITQGSALWFLPRTETEQHDDGGGWQAWDIELLPTGPCRLDGVHLGYGPTRHHYDS